MRNGERLVAALRGQPVDRLPVIEWAPWWHLTLEAWQKQGLPAELKSTAQIAEWFGLDPIERTAVRPRGPGCPPPITEGGPRLPSVSMAGYEAIRPYLFPRCTPEAAWITDLKRRRGRENEPVFWLTLEGFFWFPRTLFGIEQHMLAFYDAPDVMARMNQDLLEHNLREFESLIRICKPDFVSLAEDMSYNHGPMLSRDLFDRFITPYLRPLAAAIAAADIPFLIDSDGDVAALLPWLHDAGVHGIMPLERAAGVNVESLQQSHPDFSFIGAFDKRVISRGDRAVRDEFERLAPALRRGRFIPSVDHQTPPDVTIPQYRAYVEQLRRVAQSVQ